MRSRTGMAGASRRTVCSSLSPRKSGACMLPTSQQAWAKARGSIRSHSMSSASARRGRATTTMGTSPTSSTHPSTSPSVRGWSSAASPKRMPTSRPASLALRITRRRHSSQSSRTSSVVNAPPRRRRSASSKEGSLRLPSICVQSMRPSLCKSWTAWSRGLRPCSVRRQSGY